MAECGIVSIPYEIKDEVPIAFVVSKISKTPLLHSNRILEKIKSEVISQIGKISLIALPKEVYLVEDLPKPAVVKL